MDTGIPALTQLGFDAPRLRRGLAALRRAADHPAGSLTTIVYRAHAVKGGRVIR